MNLDDALAENMSLKATVSELQQCITDLKNHNKLLRSKLYGSSSEKRPSDSSSEQLGLFGVSATTAQETEETQQVAAHSRRVKSTLSKDEDLPAGSLPAHLPREERVIDELPARSLLS